jgi:MFS family permease
VLLQRSPETLSTRAGGAVRRSLPAVRSRRFRRVVAPMAAWVFVAPAVAFALLPSVVGADHATDGIALAAAITVITAVAGVVAQPVARRLDAQDGRNRAATAGLMLLVGGLLLGALTAYEREAWLLVPTAILLGGAYGLCLVAGLVEVQRLAHERALAGLTAIYYALAYLGFASPYLFALGANLASYAVLLLIASGLAVLTALAVRQGAADRSPLRPSLSSPARRMC